MKRLWMVGVLCMALVASPVVAHQWTHRAHTIKTNFLKTCTQARDYITAHKAQVAGITGLVVVATTGIAVSYYLYNKRCSQNNHQLEAKQIETPQQKEQDKQQVQEDMEDVAEVVAEQVQEPIVQPADSIELNGSLVRKKKNNDDYDLEFAKRCPAYERTHNFANIRLKRIKIEHGPQLDSEPLNQEKTENLKEFFKGQFSGLSFRVVGNGNNLTVDIAGDVSNNDVVIGLKEKLDEWARTQDRGSSLIFRNRKTRQDAVYVFETTLGAL